MNGPQSPDGPRPTARPDNPPESWTRRGSQSGADLVLFRARHDDLVHPVSGTHFSRLVLETPEWCNVVARTAQGRYVMVQQYRFGLGRVTLEIPGGMVDPGEAPLAAARRELREETGHGSDAWSALGAVEPNPAFQDNLLHMYLAENASPCGAPDPDPGEDIRIVELTEPELFAAIERGEVRHSLVLAALGRVLDLRGLRFAPIEPARPSNRPAKG